MSNYRFGTPFKINYELVKAVNCFLTIKSASNTAQHFSMHSLWGYKNMVSKISNGPYFNPLKLENLNMSMISQSNYCKV